MMNDRLTELLSRNLAGEATDAEVQELQQWLQLHPGDQYFAEILHTYWQHHRAVQPLQDHTPDQHFAHILEMATGQPEQEFARPGILRRMFRIAAAAAIVAAIAGTVWALIPRKQHDVIAAQPKVNEVVAGRGIRSKMVLPDGTQVWLNSDSKLQYSAGFSDSTREVELEGEAFFDVVKDPAHPFIVHTSAIDIKVLGTAFNVKSYSQDKTIETTLIHGLIEVTNKTKPELPKIILKPKEKLVFNKFAGAESAGADRADLTVRTGTAAAAIAITALPAHIADTSLVETSWVYNRLIFEGDTFQDVAVKMERWFNTRIHFRNEKVSKYRLSGSFDKESVEEALQALQYIAPFQYKINNNEVEITD
ncbi:FecR domain-containing protein [Terrimonas sp. NA20]|uniref:FecR domain-containing protein n=1 Tax=Terrimonas ginsenosidimutans TaxID=2908004 RepID=A0ABS9KV16_9BACT|nr:FecR domain-containing protein [Terrimonas ginsenosidimutans]MCG2616120.1 FecR domain-containing protein [Terrimonas ginsenosidimutans]